MTKTFWLAAVVAAATLTTISPVNAEDGCGRGAFRGPHGRCHYDRGPDRVVIAPGLVIGNFYRGRGYWDGRRYYERRERWHDGWRYR